MIVTAAITVALLCGSTWLGRRLDIKADVINSSCTSGKPSTGVAAWTWVLLPVVILAGVWLS